MKENLFEIEMTNWLIDDVGLLGRAWRETHDERMITPAMLIAWHQHINTRGDAADNAYEIDDDDADDQDVDEEVSIVKVEKKEKEKKNLTGTSWMMRKVESCITSSISRPMRISSEWDRQEQRQWQNQYKHQALKGFEYYSQNKYEIPTSIYIYRGWKSTI